MLTWEHPVEGRRYETAQLQTRLALAAMTGLRAAEIGGLRWEHFAPDLRAVTVVRRKKRTPIPEVLIIPPEAARYVEQWSLIQAMHHPPEARPAWVFPATRSGRTGTRPGADLPHGSALAAPLRRLYARAMGLEEWDGEAGRWVRRRAPTPREREVWRGRNTMSASTGTRSGAVRAAAPGGRDGRRGSGTCWATRT
jgi:integrase